MTSTPSGTRSTKRSGAGVPGVKRVKRIRVACPKASTSPSALGSPDASKATSMRSKPPAASLGVSDTTPGSATTTQSAGMRPAPKSTAAGVAATASVIFFSVTCMRSSS